MTRSLCALIGLLLLLAGSLAEEQPPREEEAGLLDCLFAANSVACASQRAARDIDRIELQVAGRAGPVPMSKVLEEGGSLIADALQAVFGPEEEESAAEEPGTQVGKVHHFPFALQC